MKKKFIISFGIIAVLLIGTLFFSVLEKPQEKFNYCNEENNLGITPLYYSEVQENFYEQIKLKMKENCLNG